MTNNEKTKILVSLPLPPPYSGVETLTQFFFQSPLKEKFQLIHVDSSNKRSNEVRGRFDHANLKMTVKNGLKILHKMTLNRPKLANIPIARNRFGFIRDGLYILICSLMGAKVVSRMTGDHFDKFYWSEGPLMRAYIRLVLRKISTIIVRADRIRRQFHGLYPEAKIETVYLPFDPHFFDDVGNTKKLSAKDGIIRVLFIGHISKAKGALDLIKSIPLVVKQLPAVKFLFAGNVIEKEYNIKFVQNSTHLCRLFWGLKDRYPEHFEYLGVVTGRAKKELLKSVDILALPSYSEGFPFVVLEGMSAGLPVIATRVGALPEVFRHGEDIFFVPTGDSQAISEAILMLSANVQIRHEIGTRGQQAITKRFNLNVFADRMKVIYESLL